MTAGYSGTPLARKLGIKPGFKLCVLNGPKDYQKQVAPLPAGVSFQKAASDDSDLIHLFESTQKGLLQGLKQLIRTLKPEGILWVSWPKKSSNVPSEVTENDIREAALPLGLVDVKVCAFDETWSGLKLVWRLENRAKKP